MCFNNHNMINHEYSEGIPSEQNFFYNFVCACITKHIFPNGI